MKIDDFKGLVYLGYPGIKLMKDGIRYTVEEVDRKKEEVYLVGTGRRALLDIRNYKGFRFTK